jgi:glycosyltransferase involved in cell wall biosynthesis
MSAVLLNLSNVPWVSGRLKRNQAIFCHLLQGESTLSAGVFVNPPVIATAPRKYVPHARLQVSATEELSGKQLSILQPYYSLPDWYVPTLTVRWASLVTVKLLKHIEGAPFWLWMNSAGKLQHGTALHLLRVATLRVFDSSDDFTAWEPPDYRVRLQELVSRSDKLLCVNDHVAATFSHPDKRVFRNCTDFDNFQRRITAFRLEPWFPKPDGAVYIGFTGGINSTRADLPLLESVFRRFPDWRFLFVGYTDDPAFLRRLLSFPNVAFVAEQPYRELPEIIRAFDVAIVPHLDNATTRGNDLLKVLDYLACGVPVVSTSCSGVERYGDVLHVARTAEAFANAIEAFVTGAVRHDPRPGLRVAAAQNWKNKVPGLTPWLTGCAAVSVP